MVGASFKATEMTFPDQDIIKIQKTIGIETGNKQTNNTQKWWVEYKKHKNHVDTSLSLRASSALSTSSSISSSPTSSSWISSDGSGGAYLNFVKIRFIITYKKNLLKYPANIR